MRAVAEGAAGLARRVARAMVTAAGASSDEGGGSPWLTDEGGILFATSSARRWLDELRAARSMGGEAVLAAIALRAAHPAGGALPRPVRLRFRVGDRWMTLHGERVVDAEGRPQGVAVVLEPAHPGTVLPLAVAAFGLTPREAEVARQILQGRNTRATAAALGISPYTVQDHLKSIFTRVGEGSRGELAHRLALALL